MKGYLKSSETKHRFEDASINFVLMSPIVIIFRNSVMINSKVELTITTFRCQGLRVLFAVNKETIHGSTTTNRCYCLDSQTSKKHIGFPQGTLVYFKVKVVCNISEFDQIRVFISIVFYHCKVRNQKTQEQNPIDSPLIVFVKCIKCIFLKKN